MGDYIDKDMVAVPIGPKICMAAVATPSYLAANPEPAAPGDLVHCRCINIRFTAQSGIYVWASERQGQPLNVRVLEDWCQPFAGYFLY